MNKGTGLLLLGLGIAALAFGGSRKSAASTGGTSGGGGGGGGDTVPEPGGGDGSTGPMTYVGPLSFDPDWKLRNALCKRPTQLSFAEQTAIREKLIAPAYDARAAELPQQAGPQQVDAFLTNVAKDVASRCTPSPSQTTIRTLAGIARSQWWIKTGQSGQ